MTSQADMMTSEVLVCDSSQITVCQHLFSANLGFGKWKVIQWTPSITEAFPRSNDTSPCVCTCLSASICMNSYNPLNISHSHQNALQRFKQDSAPLAQLWIGTYIYIYLFICDFLCILYISEQWSNTTKCTIFIKYGVLTMWPTCFGLYRHHQGNISQQYQEITTCHIYN